MRLVRPAVLTGALLLAIGSVGIFAPGYWTDLGLPLDDSWIHAVYGREVARSAMLAYNPGIPAAGETSPLWAVVWAVPHLVTQDTAVVVLLIKAIGFALHALTVVFAVRVTERLNAGPLIGGTSGLLVALHPDLLASSISGMELPLATALTLWTVLETLRGPSWRLAVACFLAPLGRPEVACIAVFTLTTRLLTEGYGPAWRRLLMNLRSRAFLHLAATAGAGTLASFALVAVRNMQVTGHAMPTTFYAKAGARGLSPWFVQWLGFGRLLEQFALTHVVLLAPLTVLALWLLLRRLTASAAHETRTSNAPSAHDPSTALRERSRDDARAAALLLTGIAFFSASFALTPPRGVTAFYFQRYSLPGLPLVLIALPLVLDVALRAAPAPRRALLRAAVTIALAVGLLAPMPSRLWRLANDTRNIDDVQVAEGRALGNAAPHHTVWAVDAGAIRYFGNAFVVDTVGLNTPEMLTPVWREYLARHQPHYFSIVGGWSQLDAESTRVMTVQVFRPSTRYTVTGFLPQAVHALTRCPTEPHAGIYTVFNRQTDFHCGRW